ncbi:MAG TPA: Clp protease ClpP [Rhodospirillaceae bacterium]|nr:MAG: hypothetical protein A2018_05620 [Alphaproteobacteria bacterium GWF2_58_20]HAU28993.1 Clp protease ClpP [Rhodospirillaceae bacterium]
MPDYPHLFGRLLGAPLMIDARKGNVVLAALSDRLKLAAPLPMPEPPETRADAARQNIGGIAVIPVVGTLIKRGGWMEAESGLTTYDGVSAAINAALADPLVSAILLDIDSCGGEASGAFDLADEVYTARGIKPIWAVANDSAFSAAYALASSAERVFVTRTGGAGSIGVIAWHVDHSGANAKAGIAVTPIFSGAHKADAAPDFPLSDVAASAISDEVARIYGMFVETVARNRGLSPEAVRATEAACFYGENAVAAGLADEVGTLDDAIAALSSFVSQGGTMPEETMKPEAQQPAGYTHAEAAEIAMVCIEAKRPELAAELLASGTSLETARGRLVEALAAASPDISTAQQPSAGAAPAPRIDAAAIYNRRREILKGE